MTGRRPPAFPGSRDPEETRRALLDAGIEAFAADPSRPPTVAEVVRRAGVTHGAFYWHWPDGQAEYFASLVDDIMSRTAAAVGPVAQRLESHLSELIAARSEGRIPKVGLADLVRELAPVSREPWSHGGRPRPEARVWMALWSRDDPRINARLREEYGRYTDRYEAVFLVAFDAYGIEPRPPWNVRSLIGLFTAIAEGVMVRSGVEPDDISGDFIVDAFLAVLPGVLRRRGDDRGIDELIDDVLFGAGSAGT